MSFNTGGHITFSLWFFIFNFWVLQILYPNDSTTCPVVSTISKYEIENPQFELFPTPVTSFVNITSTVPIEEINIYNTTGQLVLHQTSTNSTTINTEQLADGIYFYELRSNKETLKTGKLIKQ
ncbi:MAG: T9SS type A sorting domain-containing protein [Bacteroidetes bacterium]|nr:T9SS type A sorting domain-containing protein [Bacteroidota bacterium]